MVRLHLGPPCNIMGAVVQLGERLICIQEVSGSIPLGSTFLIVVVDTCHGMYLQYTIRIMHKNIDN